jgi:hypothetical protein
MIPSHRHPGALRAVFSPDGEDSRKFEADGLWAAATQKWYLAEACGSRTHPSRETREATGFEDREGHRAPLASTPIAGLGA